MTQRPLMAASITFSLALVTCTSGDTTFRASRTAPESSDPAADAENPAAAETSAPTLESENIGQFRAAISYSTLLTTTCSNATAGRVYYVDDVGREQSNDLMGYYFCKPGSGRSGWVKLTPPEGDTGPTGPSGAPGADGSDGATGPQGPTGPAGANGSDGATGGEGPTGMSGSNGKDGSDGKDGSTGAAGDSGPPGPMGAPGATGAQGIAGPSGPAGRASPPLIEVNAEPPGTHCAEGGVAISVGWDVDGDGEFDSGEATSTAYQCSSLPAASCPNPSSCPADGPPPCSGAACLGVLGAGCRDDADCGSGSCCANVCRDLASDAANCGACGTACSGASNAVGLCLAGSCSVSCVADHADCDADATNGCERDLGHADNACSGASDLGVLGTAQALVFSGTRPTWIAVRLPPACTGSNCPKEQRALFRLTSPEKVHYELFVNSSCSAFLTASQSGSSPEWVQMDLGATTATIFLEIRRSSGSSCEPWSLSGEISASPP